MSRKKARPAVPANPGHDEAGERQDDGGAYEGLSPKQARAVDALLRGQTTAASAISAGVHERTLRRWLHEPPVRKALMEARREAFAQAVGLTARYAPLAVATLVKVMNDGSCSPAARVTAAAVLLKFGREGLELDDLAARVEQLEQAATVLGSPLASEARPLRLAVGDDDEEA